MVVTRFDYVDGIVYARVVRYPGGKNGSGAYQTIINQIPPHRIYLELFLGSGAVFRRIRPAEISIGLDLDPETCDLHQNDRASVEKLRNLPPGQWVASGCALDFLECVADKLDRSCFIYLDPPCLESTRRSKSPIYRREFETEPQHLRLLRTLKTINANVCLSGYQSLLYYAELEEWRRLDYQLSTRQGLATESLWCNYPEPKELHDYRYLGTDRTDRQRIKRKKERFVKKLERMPLQERYAILSALEEWRVATADAYDYDAGRVDDFDYSCSSRHF